MAWSVLDHSGLNVLRLNPESVIMLVIVLFGMEHNVVWCVI